MAAGNLAVDPVMQLATIGVLGVGAQWVAWRLRVPAIVLMLGIGLLARPITVYLSMLGTKIPRSERTLVAFTGPRGVVLVAVAGLFGERLVALGIADGAMMAPLAFGFVAVTVCVAWIYIDTRGAGLGVVRRGCAGCFDRWGHQFGYATWGTFA